MSGPGNDWERSTRTDRYRTARVHVLPFNDLRAHVEHPSCWCRPSTDAEFPNVWVHHALDQRELVEQGARLLQ